MQTILGSQESIDSYNDESISFSAKNKSKIKHNLIIDDSPLVDLNSSSITEKEKEKNRHFRFSETTDESSMQDSIYKNKKNFDKEKILVVGDSFETNSSGRSQSSKQESDISDDDDDDDDDDDNENENENSEIYLTSEENEAGLFSSKKKNNYSSKKYNHSAKKKNETLENTEFVNDSQNEQESIAMIRQYRDNSKIESDNSSNEEEESKSELSESNNSDNHNDDDDDDESILYKNKNKKAILDSNSSEKEKSSNIEIVDSDAEKSFEKNENKNESTDSSLQERLKAAQKSENESLEDIKKSLEYDDEKENDFEVSKIKSQYSSKPNNSPDKSKSSTESNKDEVILLSDSPFVQPIPKKLVQAKIGPNFNLTPKFEKLQQDNRTLSSWSPNFEKELPKTEFKLPKIKDEKVLEKGIKMLNLDDQEQDKRMAAALNKDKHTFNASSLQAQALRGTTTQITNRNMNFENKLKLLSEELIQELEKKPNPDDSTEDMEMPIGLKVSLLPHQRYSMLWLKWREKSYPHGGILADDMGLGKTLTILAYLKLVKDEKEKIMSKKLDKQKEEPIDEDDAEERLNNERKKIFQKKYTNKLDTHEVKRLRTLIVLPASLLHQWQGEITNKFHRDSFKYHVYHEANRKKHAYNLEDNDIVFTTYEIISREMDILDKDGNLGSNDSPLARIKWKRIILDEAHRIKNHNTKASKVCSAIKARYRIAITGTPIHNSINDLYSLTKYLNFEPLDDFVLWKYLFASEQVTKAQTKNNEIREKRCSQWILLLSEYLILRRTKADKIKGTEKRIVDLPEKNILEVKIKLNQSEKAIYTKIFNESKDKVSKFLSTQKQRAMGRTSNSEGSGLSEIFVYLLRLRQACCHMSLLSECLDRDELQNMRLEAEGIDGLMQSLNLNESSMTKVEKTEPLMDNIQENVDLSKCLKKSFMSSKLESLLNMIEEISKEHPDDKMIIVSQWTSILSIVARNLQKRQIVFCEIKGEIMLFKRNEIVEEFNKQENTDVRVMLLSLTAGGVGLNLIGANRMFLLDIHWNPALEQQCADRIYRVGQTKSCYIYKFLCENTIEQRIQEIQAKKIEIADKVCNASAANIPGATGTIKNAKLTSQDLKLLFQDFEEER